MWRETIVTAVRGPHNDADPAVRAQVASLNGLWVILRIVLGVNLVTQLVDDVSDHGAPLTLWVIVAVCTALNELLIVYVRHSRTERQVTLRVTASASLLSVGAFAVMHSYGGAVGVLAYVVILAAYAPVLPATAVAALAALCAALVGGDALIDHLGIDVFPGHHQRIGWIGWLASALIFFEVAGMSYLFTNRLDRARRRVQTLVEQLSGAQDRLSASNRRLERWNEELNTEVQRQTAELARRGRRMEVINAVSVALSEAVEDDVSFDHALTRLGTLMGACSVHLFLSQQGEHKATIQRVQLHDYHEPTEPPSGVLQRVAVGDEPRCLGRTTAVAVDGESIPCQFGAVPLVAKGRIQGTLALCREGDWDYAEDDLEAIAMIGRELGAAIEHRYDYREAKGRASREALLNRVTRGLDETHDTAAAMEQALHHAATWIGATEAALVVHSPDSRRYHVAARYHSGHGSTEADAEEALVRLFVSVPSLVADRPNAMLIGPQGELPISEDVAALGIGSLLVAPVSLHRMPAGAVVIVGDGARRWGSPQREVASRLAEQLGARLESDELMRLQTRRINELSGLARVAEVVQSTVDPARLFRGFARAAAELVPFRAMYVALPQGTGHIEVTAYDADGRPTPIDTPREALAHPWFGLRAVTQVSLEDAPPPSFYRSPAPPVVVPLRPKGDVLGIVVLEPTEPLQPEQVALVAQAVGQLALALDSAALYRQATERAARIQVLGNLARIVASVVDLRDAFDAFAEEVRWLIPFDRALMLRVDGAAGVVEPYAACPGEDGPPATPSDLRTSPAWPAYASRQAVRLRRDEAVAAGADWTIFGTADEVAVVPILQGAECTAMFVLAHSGGEPYAPGDIGALEEVARLLAVSIERADLFQQAAYNARHDLLTGLPNTRYLQEQLGTFEADREAEASIVMLDMDDLKLFNDTLGHNVGDQVIAIVGEAVRTSCRTTDFVARVGGDEFVVLMQGADGDAAEAVAARIHDRLHGASQSIPGAPADIRVSIGVASSPDDATSAGELLHAADVAMYTAKFAGGGRTARSGGAVPDRTQHAHRRRRPGRLVDTVVQAATASATPCEREAITLAQQYAVAAALRLGAPEADAEVVSMLVARHAGRRLLDARPGSDQGLAAAMLDELARQWGERWPHAPTLGHAAVEAAVQLAWLQQPAPYGSGCTPSEALDRLAETSRTAEETAVQQAMATVLGEQGLGDPAARAA